MSSRSFSGGRGVRLLLAAFSLACLFALGATAQADATVTWRLDALGNTTAQVGQPYVYIVRAVNVGAEASDGSAIEFTAELPDGVTALNTVGTNHVTCPTNVVGQSEIHCTGNEVIGHSNFALMVLSVAVAPSAPDSLTAHFQFHGGGSTQTLRTVRVATLATEPPEFGLEAVDFDSANGYDTGLSTQAGGHPILSTTSIEFNTTNSSGLAAFGGAVFPSRNILWPVEAPKDVIAHLPPGYLGDPTSVQACSQSDLAHSAPSPIEPLPNCLPNAQVGTVSVLSFGEVFGPVPLYRLVAPPDVPARFGFNVVGTVVTLDAAVRSGSDYGLDVIASNASEGLAITGTHVTFWGVPSDPIHDPERGCAGQKEPWEVSGGGCPSHDPPTPFLRNPTSCPADPGEGYAVTLSTDSWKHPGSFDSKTTVSHESPGFPYAPVDRGDERGLDGCASVPFQPLISATPTTDAADSPSGLTFDITVPQKCWDPNEVDSVCQSDLKDAEVDLPKGITLNPSAADGLASCSPSQIGYIDGTSNPEEFSPTAAQCPDAAKIGDVTIESPLLDDVLKGSVYLAQQGDNPFGSLLAMYLVAEGSGVVVKQAGEISIGDDGHLTTSFHHTPQLPFEHLRLNLFGGTRATLRTPPTCGTYTTQATLTPWSGNAPVDLSDSFQVTSGPSGSPCPTATFDPQLSAGTANPLAGAFSPFSLRLTRADGTQELGSLRATLPPGLLGSLRGIPYCPDATLAAISGALGTGAAQIASPSCPPASQVGTVTVGAGAGPNPFYTSSGRAYLAGPYKGAPLSLAVVTPAVAGPFDLGNVVVRNALQLDPQTAQITAISDPLPQVLHGIPLDLRDVRVDLGRPGFTLNPTSCDPMAVNASLTSTSGAAANRSSRFQVANCDKLAFKPRLSLRLKGGTKRSEYPALRAQLTMPKGGANIARTTVALPHSEFLAQNHIGTICTRPLFAADACPARSVYGHARAFSPLLDQPLEGPVYLRANGGERELPDLVASLKGQIDIELEGHIDSANGGIRTSFETVPDAPVSKFVLSMKGGKKGLLENSRNLCRSTNRATVLIDAQNGKTADSRPELRVKCGKGEAK
jgi:hypothetical protein